MTTYGRNESDEFPLPANYIEAVQRGGGSCLLLAPHAIDVDAILDVADGVVLAGGGDLNPQRYGGSHHSTIYMIDDERDRAEIALATALAARHVPTLAVCRGIQVLNVVMGGTLIPHLPDVVGETTLHRAPPRRPIEHVVTVQSDCALARVMSASQVTIASWHHQGLDQVAAPLRVVGHAPDGVIEACEVAGWDDCLAVQWHPEITAHVDPTQQRLFNWLVERAAASRGQHRRGSA